MSNVDRAEIKHFEQLAHEFWDPHGSYSLLILMNPTRVHYIVQHLKSQGVDSLEGVSVLDVGCGGGLLSEVTCRCVDDGSSRLQSWVPK
jgi:2-polyprenyl-6-hydroxyphenyl methylase/3-demethylubiquinone-9 3-methyltransferase